MQEVTLQPTNRVYLPAGRFGTRFVAPDDAGLPYPAQEQRYKEDHAVDIIDACTFFVC